MLFDIEDNMIKFVGLDADGVRRVWGEGKDALAAKDECKKAVREYCTRRPEFQSHFWTVISEDEWRERSTPFDKDAIVAQLIRRA